MSAQPAEPPPAPRRVIVDASSLVRGALTPAPAARRLVDAALAHGFFAASAPILDEVEEVLARPKFARRLRIGALLVVPGEAVQACRDPADDKYLEAAVARPAPLAPPARW